MKHDLYELLVWALQFNKTAKIKDGYIIIDNNCFSCFNKNLTELPDNIDKLKVNEFDCSFNRIVELPGSIGNMKVNDFHCSFNRIVELPGSIGNMKVSNFHCSNNQIAKLPDSIGNMKVYTFCCSFNQLVTLPDSIGNMKVERFYCSYNKIAELPDSIINMKVKNFDCHNNFLEVYYIRPNKLIEGIFEDEGYCYLDGIFSHIINIKIKDNVKIIKTLNSYIVTDGINHAHGEDIKSSYLDYKFKTSTKDLEQYKLIDINELHNLDYLYQAYRNITGSCQLGMSNWISRNNNFIEKTEKSGSSIAELLEITKNNFGNTKLIEFFN